MNNTLAGTNLNISITTITLNKIRVSLANTIFTINTISIIDTIFIVNITISSI